MRLLLINSIGRNKWGGGEKWMILSAKELINKGHHVVIGCHSNSVLEQRAKEQQIPVYNISIYTDFSLKGFFQIKKIVAKERINIIIGCQNKDVRVAGFYSKLHKGPQVISRQGVQLLHNSVKYKFGFIPFCNGIITNTNSIKNEYDSYGWWDKDFVRVIYNGISTNSHSEDTFDFKQFIPKQDKSPFIVVSTGRLSKQKGFDYLVKAAKKLVQKYPHVHFFIAGKGKQEHQLQTLIKELKLEANVHLIGFCTNVSALLNGADLFVLPSLYEGMPNSLMEALSHGLPVVSTKVNGVSELMVDQQHGLIVPPGNVPALEDAISELLNKEDISNMGQLGKQHVKKYFSIDQMTNNLESYLLDKLNAQGS